MGARARLRLGILGTGGINDKFLVGASQVPEVDVAAVASRNIGRARSFAARHGIRAAFGSYEELLADTTIDAVYVALPNSLHHTWTVASLAAGKHVLCEKPYSRRPADVEEAFAEADRRGLVLAEGFMWRHTPQTKRLLELLSTIGDLETVRATFSFILEDAADIRLRADLDGGCLMDIGCYCVSAARLLAGEEPKSAWGTQIVGPTGVDVRFTGVLRFPSGVIAEFSAGFSTDHVGLEAIGQKGSIQVPNPWHQAGTLLVNGELVRVEPLDPYGLELAEMAATIRGDSVAKFGRADALGQARAIAALYESAKVGAVVSL